MKLSLRERGELREMDVSAEERGYGGAAINGEERGIVEDEDLDSFLQCRPRWLQSTAPFCFSFFFCSIF